MIRYVFDTWEQLARHLHAGSHSALLFLASRGSLPAQQECMVELRIRGEPRSAIVRGRFVAFAEGGLTRAWLQLPDARLLTRIHSGAGFALPRVGRVQSNDLLRIRNSAGGETVMRLIDMGARGLRVRGTRALRAGQVWSTAVVGPSGTVELGDARVSRVETRGSAMLFVQPVSGPVLEYLRSLRNRWASAPVVEHPAECCAGEVKVTPLTVARLSVRRPSRRMPA